MPASAKHVRDQFACVRFRENAAVYLCPHLRAAEMLRKPRRPTQRLFTSLRADAEIERMSPSTFFYCASLACFAISAATHEDRETVGEFRHARKRSTKVERKKVAWEETIHERRPSRGRLFRLAHIYLFCNINFPTLVFPHSTLAGGHRI